jgi:succinate dehydrogenase hydrophobic anchor subunit
MIGVILFLLIVAYVYVLLRIKKQDYEEPIKPNSRKHMSGWSLPNMESVSLIVLFDLIIFIIMFSLMYVQFS